jgi:hypothetical protein
VCLPYSKNNVLNILSIAKNNAKQTPKLGVNAVTY